MKSGVSRFSASRTNQGTYLVDCEPRKLLSEPTTLMTPHDPLRPLHDLDRASPQFHKQLIDFLRGNEYQGVVPGLQNEDLAWLVEYLDSVSIQPSFWAALRSTLTLG